MDWIYDDEIRLSTGPDREPKKGEAVVWSRHFKQGVYIRGDYRKAPRPEVIEASVAFNPLNSDVSFSVKE